MSAGWMDFKGKGDPGCKITVKCHCGKKTRLTTNPVVGTEFYCRSHGLVAFMEITK